MSREHRLLCDEMLGALARWLRAAGHDAALMERGAPDDDLLARAAAEERTLLTRDRALAARDGRSLLLPGGLDAQAAALKAKLDLDWLHAPFTRCMADGTPLRRASADDLGRMPEPSRGLPGPFTACPACRRVYWPGSHVRRMRTRLEGWAQQAKARPYPS